MRGMNTKEILQSCDPIRVDLVKTAPKPHDLFKMPFGTWHESHTREESSGDPKMKIAILINSA